jgi:hypothetical protein
VLVGNQKVSEIEENFTIDSNGDFKQNVRNIYLNLSGDLAHPATPQN